MPLSKVYALFRWAVERSLIDFSFFFNVQMIGNFSSIQEELIKYSTIRLSNAERHLSRSESIRPQTPNY